MKLSSFMLAIVPVAVLLADEAALSKEELRYRRTGGEIVKRGTYTGKVLFANTQKKLPASEIGGVCREIESAVNVRMECIETAEKNPARLLRDKGANAVLIVVDDPGSPILLVAPEDRWAIVNMAKLVDDLPGANAKSKFFVPRARKEIIKGFSLMCGGGSSQFPDNIMNTASVRELDMVKEQIPADMIEFWTRFLGRIGVTAKEMTTYKTACREGWAPTPTNDVQKAIWDKVHATPKNPMKIEFDPKKGR